MIISKDISSLSSSCDVSCGLMLCLELVHVAVGKHVNM